MNRIVCSIVKLFLMPVMIVLTVFLIVMLIAYGGQPLRDIGDGIQETGTKINRCLHKVADGIDRIKKVPEKTVDKFKEIKKTTRPWQH